MTGQMDSRDPKEDRAVQGASLDEHEVGLIDLLIVLSKHKRLVLGLPLATGIVAAIVSVLLPNIYTGTARILPPQQSASAASALLNQLGGTLGGFASMACRAGPGFRNPYSFV